ncbi:MAG TPA: reverse transcriptase domain-containing protein [Anaerolineaceae bacterium]
MKTYRNLYPKLCSFENLYTAYRKARKGKRSKPEVAGFERNQEEFLFNIQEELESKTYKPGRYRSFHIHEPKRRLISAAPFRDRVVHHALCQVMEPIWEARFIFDSYANRLGKGTHRALDRAQAFSRKHEYVLQCDVRQFFPSIDHAILRAEFERLIADQDVLWLCGQILDSGRSVPADEYEMAWFAGDDLLAATRPRGLPIGNLTSQFWANIYLNSLDQYVKRELKCGAYLRYVDDFLLFGNDKKELARWREKIIQKLAELRLKLHEGRAQVYPVSTGIPFLGFRIYPDHRRLKPACGYRFQRRLAGLVKAARENPENLAGLNASIRGWVNHVRYGNTWGLRRAMLGRIRL